MSWAVVLGGSSRVGAACAARLAEDGHSVAIQYLRHESEAEAAASAVESRGAKAMPVRHRLDREGDATALCEGLLAKLGEVEVLVVASAAGVMRPAAELSEHHLNWTMRATAIPLAAATRTLSPRSAIAISSTGASRAVPAYTAIGMAKAAMEAAVRYLAVELAPATRVNAIEAGLMRAGGAARLPDYDTLSRDASALTPAGRLVEPEDIAELCAFLAGERSAMLTGAVLPLDGGYRLLW
ncbi:MAG: SDR family oxidoreductase [Actinomycetota bacterium]|nr:SDR family oxidoreductase [Actinomycetota bacterium]MDA8209085.1 SDR family oxidoreductase [Actinomycetota bacterium]